METDKIFHSLPFWQPVSFSSEKFETMSCVSNAILSFAQFADSCFSWHSHSIELKMDSTKQWKAIEKENVSSNWKTAAKIVACVFGGLLLFPVKALYKFCYLPEVAMESPKKSEPPAPKLEAKKIEPTNPPKEQNILFRSIKIGNTTFSLKFGNLLNEPADAIVNAAMPSLHAGGGICRDIHKKAGQEPFSECQQIRTALKVDGIEVGTAVMTTAGKLSGQNKAIIHAVGPNLATGAPPTEEQKTQLKNAYKNSLLLAMGKHSDQTKRMSEDVSQTFQPLKSIAFVSISTGLYNFPLNQAASLAIEAISNCLKEYADSSLEEVSFIFFPPEKDLKQKTYQHYENALDVYQNSHGS